MVRLKYFAHLSPTGQTLRTRMPADAFRYWFLIAMIFLGLYIAAAAIYKMIVP